MKGICSGQLVWAGNAKAGAEGQQVAARGPGIERKKCILMQTSQSFSQFCNTGKGVVPWWWDVVAVTFSYWSCGEDCAAD